MINLKGDEKTRTLNMHAVLTYTWRAASSSTLSQAEHSERPHSLQV